MNQITQTGISEKLYDGVQPPPKTAMRVEHPKGLAPARSEILSLSHPQKKKPTRPLEDKRISDESVKAFERKDSQAPLRRTEAANIPVLSTKSNASKTRLVRNQNELKSLNQDKDI